MMGLEDILPFLLKWPLFRGELLNFGGVYLFLAFVKEYNINQLRGGISIPLHDLKRPEFLWIMDAGLFTTLRHFWKGQELECHSLLCGYFLLVFVYHIYIYIIYIYIFVAWWLMVVVSKLAYDQNESL